jgi:hypothetical protein
MEKIKPQGQPRYEAGDPQKSNIIAGDDDEMATHNATLAVVPPLPNLLRSYHHWAGEKNASHSRVPPPITSDMSNFGIIIP